MSKRNVKLFVEDMLNAIEKIEKYCKGIGSYEEFSKQDIVVDAVLRNLEIIGEAASKIPENIRSRFSEIPWKRVVGLRNIIVHGYFVVDLQIVWRIITSQLPELRIALEKMRAEL
ncbi:HepT-like ribonuclease domain-containing protein [Pseudothermotoga thermarum]|uniref:DUF86 domain-containing protein n=1 Tax=Pseudothermotoga thermarum DSM 5069 TaxID=688269 RepID=F7YVR7_9THEM|nr:DUF86 domain-containing protein [Pseudothermotoga thermarum]AEH51735.1 protein of unknown function DUF86 [Pseudothermotoga thermarum DSM 5069]